MNKSRGFTLLELMVVVAIVAILSTLAAPSFQRLIQSTTMSNTVNTFLADMRFARSESIRRGGGVVMCRSAAPEAVIPTCSTGSGAGGNGWASGWIVYQDLNADGVITTDELLRVQSQMTSIQTIKEEGNFSKFQFTATGRLVPTPSLPFEETGLTFGGSNYSDEVSRLVCVSYGGRASVAGNGTSRCAS